VTSSMVSMLLRGDAMRCACGRWDAGRDDESRCLAGRTGAGWGTKFVGEYG
jgi:hypothetical protein